MNAKQWFKDYGPILSVLVMVGFFIYILWGSKPKQSKDTQTQTAPTQTSLAKPAEQGDQSLKLYAAEQKIIALQEDLKKLQEDCCEGKKQEKTSRGRRPYRPPRKVNTTEKIDNSINVRIDISTPTPAPKEITIANDPRPAPILQVNTSPEKKFHVTQVRNTVKIDY